MNWQRCRQLRIETASKLPRPKSVVISLKLKACLLSGGEVITQQQHGRPDDGSNETGRLALLVPAQKLPQVSRGQLSTNA